MFRASAVFSLMRASDSNLSAQPASVSDARRTAEAVRMGRVMVLLLPGGEGNATSFGGDAVAVGFDAVRQLGAAEINGAAATQRRRAAAEDDRLVGAQSRAHLV